MKKYGKLKKEEIKKQFDAMVQENIEYFDYINLEAKKHIKEVIEYAAQKKS